MENSEIFELVILISALFTIVILSIKISVKRIIMYYVNECVKWPDDIVFYPILSTITLGFIIFVFIDNLYCCSILREILPKEIIILTFFVYSISLSWVLLKALIRYLVRRKIPGIKFKRFSIIPIIK
jgi:hypothetical protein